MREEIDQLATALYDRGCVKFGAFKLKSGLTSPIYIDLRLLVTYPRLLRMVASTLSKVAADMPFDRIAAIPYAALPIGVAMALELERPMIYPRREVKAHGTRRAIEGEFKSGETALLVDDLITRGDSKLEAIETLEAADLAVEDVLVLIDREQGGPEDLARHGYRLHAVLTLAQILEILRKNERIAEDQYLDVLTYLERSQAP